MKNVKNLGEKCHFIGSRKVEKTGKTFEFVGTESILVTELKSGLVKRF